MKSKCCNAEVKKGHRNTVIDYFCTECRIECEVIETDKTKEREMPEPHNPPGQCPKCDGWPLGLTAKGKICKCEVKPKEQQSEKVSLQIQVSDEQTAYDVAILWGTTDDEVGRLGGQIDNYAKEQVAQAVKEREQEMMIHMVVTLQALKLKYLANKDVNATWLPIPSDEIDKLIDIIQSKIEKE